MKNRIAVLWGFLSPWFSVTFYGIVPRSGGILVFILALGLLTGCEDKTVERQTYMANVPVYMSYETLRTPISGQPPKSMSQTGKIYLQGHHILINEPFKGIHVVDNFNPQAPVKVSFIPIPGNVDIAYFDNYLYVDSYVDLVVLDFTNPEAVSEVKRVLGAFSYTVPVYNFDYPVGNLDETNGVITGWKIEEIVEENVTYGTFNYYPGYMDGVMAFSEGAVAPNNSGGSGGQAGSMARFIAIEGYLYTIDHSNLTVYSLSDRTNPAEENIIQVSSDIETLYPFDDKLFVGSKTGMYVYSLSVPSLPTYISEFQHARSCDPVVVDRDFAYVTLRSGSACQGFTNQLDVIDKS